MKPLHEEERDDGRHCDPWRFGRSPEGDPADLEAISEARVAAARTLTLQPSAADLANPAVLAEFAALRRYLRGEATAVADRGGWPQSFRHLGFSRRDWRDLMVIDPDGETVDLGDGARKVASDPDLLSFSADEVEAALARLRDIEDDDLLELEFDPLPSPSPSMPPMPSRSEGLTPIAVPRYDGAEIRAAFIGDVLARAPRLATPPPLALVGRTQAEGQALRQGFFDAVADAALTRMGDALVSEDFLDADANGDAPIVAAMPDPGPLTVFEPSRGDDVGSAHADAPLPAPEILAALDREVGEGIRRAFLTAHLQSTLQALKKTRGGPTPRALRAVSQVEAARIASDFLDGIVARVRSGVPPPERPTAG